MRIILLSSFIFSASILLSQNVKDSIGENKNSSTPSRQYRAIERPRDLVPHNEGTMKQPLPRRKVEGPQPNPKQAPRTSEMLGKGKTVEDKITDPWLHTPTRRHLNRWYRNITGFRGFVDKGLSTGIGNQTNHRADWYGSFGYQLNPLFYVGIGQGYSLSLNKKESSAPSFVNVRVNFLDENTTPFFDLKTGYSFVGGKGMYLNPNFGMSFGKKRRAWNIGVGYSFQKVQVKKSDVKYKYNYHGVTLRATFEFGL